MSAVEDIRPAAVTGPNKPEEQHETEGLPR